MAEPNPAQRALIDHEGSVLCVDAGPGTGKTFAITRRYARLVDETDAEPADVLLATFTESAATEMHDRIVSQSSYDVREFADAPIGTFHSLCLDVLAEYGREAPAYLGLDAPIAGSPRVLDDRLVEEDRFRAFLAAFRDSHPEHARYFRVLDEDTELLDLLKRLAARGIAPTEAGWYRNGADNLAGDREAFVDRLEAVNAPRNDGSKQSKLRSRLGDYDDGCYTPDAPTKDDIRGARGQKTVDEDALSRAFDDDRSGLTDFVHDVYYGYLQFALERGYLTFGFLQLLTFVLLCEDHALRAELAHEHVLLDEFQDTSEIQFKLALLLAGSADVCVVGDWKQSIYSFQYAEVENIRSFEERLAAFVADLNADHERVAFDPAPVRTIELVENYRSTASILEFSEEVLVAEATDRESVDARSIREDIVSLEANAAVDESRIAAIHHDDEHAAVLSKVQEVVGNDDYPVTDEDGQRRTPTYGDVTVLTRTREYGRELLALAREHDVPLAYDGDIAVFRTDAAKLLLAWLRIAEEDADRGWAVVLERAGYAPAEIGHVLETGEYPDDAVAFREDLGDVGTIPGFARRVFDRYGLAGPRVDAICTTLASIRSGTTLSRGELIRYVERAIETGATHEVDASTDCDAVTVQTIHGAKGREYPIVILANMNRHAFPPSGGGPPAITYDATLGLRQLKRYAEAHGRPHVYDDWRDAVLRPCLSRGYDEERRLLYVATTRAEHHVLFAAGERPNGFLESLPIDVEIHEPAVEAVDRRGTEQTRLPIAVPPPSGPEGLTPHDLMAASDAAGTSDATGEDDRDSGRDDGRGAARGRDFGNRVHGFAERYARGADVTPGDDRGDEGKVAAFVDSLEGTIHVEQPATLPLTVHGQRVVVSGSIDLMAITPETATVVDFKTDVGRERLPEYRIQLSCYYHVVDAVYPDRTIEPCLYFTADGNRVAVQPRRLSEIEDLVAEHIGGA